MERKTRIRISDRPAKRFRVTDASPRRLSHRTVAKALGAQVVGPSRTRPKSPTAVIALREKVGAMLRSTGGRPALEGAAERKKVPVIKGDWKKLELVAASFAQAGTKASPAQLASLLLHEKLQELERKGIGGLPIAAV